MGHRTRRWFRPGAHEKVELNEKTLGYPGKEGDWMDREGKRLGRTENCLWGGEGWPWGRVGWPGGSQLCSGYRHSPCPWCFLPSLYPVCQVVWNLLECQLRPAESFFAPAVWPRRGFALTAQVSGGKH